MNAIKRFGWALSIAAVMSTTLFAGETAYDNAVNKAMHPGRAHVVRPSRVYTQPRVYVQPRRTYVTPQVAATPAPAARQTFSYEPATAVAPAERRTYSYEPVRPAYVAPRSFSNRAYTGRSYENATNKALGRIPF